MTTNVVAVVVVGVGVVVIKFSNPSNFAVSQFIVIKLRLLLVTIFPISVSCRIFKLI